jgi:hypothetical protein
MFWKSGEEGIRIPKKKKKEEKKIHDVQESSVLQSVKQHRFWTCPLTN